MCFVDCDIVLRPDTLGICPWYLPVHITLSRGQESCRRSKFVDLSSTLIVGKTQRSPAQLSTDYQWPYTCPLWLLEAKTIRKEFCLYVNRSKFGFIPEAIRLVNRLVCSTRIGQFTLLIGQCLHFLTWCPHDVGHCWTAMDWSLYVLCKNILHSRNDCAVQLMQSGYLQKRNELSYFICFTHFSSFISSQHWSYPNPTIMLLTVDVLLLSAPVRYRWSGGVRLEVGHPVNLPRLPTLHPAKLWGHAHCTGCHRTQTSK